MTTSVEPRPEAVGWTGLSTLPVGSEVLLPGARRRAPRQRRLQGALPDDRPWEAAARLRAQRERPELRAQRELVPARVGFRRVPGGC
jgi:hypothetical protein